MQGNVLLWPNVELKLKGFLGSVLVLSFLNARRRGRHGRMNHGARVQTNLLNLRRLSSTLVRSVLWGQRLLILAPRCCLRCFNCAYIV